MALGGWYRGRVLGRGSTATVSLATAHGSGELFSVKTAELAYSCPMQQEQKILSSLDCENVVSCLGYDVSADRYNLFLEYAPGGSLADEIVRHGCKLAEPALKSRAAEIVTGLAYLHSRKIVHCDIKSRNILIGSDGHAKIADLGCARFFDEDGTRMRGTPMFMAPEVARGESQGPAADVWAFGCVAIEMATGRTPWPDMSDAITVLHRIAFSEDVPAVPEWMSGEGKDFLSKCLRRDPDERWTADQLLKHPFLLGSGKSDAERKWTSPKCILNARIWECLEDEEDTYAEPRRMIAELVSSGPNWTWDEDWLTIRTDGEQTDEDPVIPASSNEDAVIFSTVITTTSTSSSLLSLLHPDTDTDTSEDCCSVSSSRNLMNCSTVNIDQFSCKSLLVTSFGHNIIKYLLGSVATNRGSKFPHTRSE